MKGPVREIQTPAQMEAYAAKEAEGNPTPKGERRRVVIPSGHELFYRNPVLMTASIARQIAELPDFMPIHAALLSSLDATGEARDCADIATLEMLKAMADVQAMLRGIVQRGQQGLAAAEEGKGPALRKGNQQEDPRILLPVHVANRIAAERAEKAAADAAAAAAAKPGLILPDEGTP